MTQEKNSIISRARTYQASASQHRLNQRPIPNVGLQAANAAQVKANIALLRSQQSSKGDIITVEATLYIFPKNGANAKKVCFFLSLFLSSLLMPLFLGPASTSIEEVPWIRSRKHDFEPHANRTSKDVGRYPVNERLQFSEL
jgi:hypothetical protein